MAGEIDYLYTNAEELSASVGSINNMTIVKIIWAILNSILIIGIVVMFILTKKKNAYLSSESERAVSIHYFKSLLHYHI
jgi:hypothetical protein